ncbi:hypothetical protein M0R04_11430 [Candidatus Dojkabacteria bacterium]|jgi:hypothetical protein|nr:hypothetical protein [Candidatus Dojkabacteria bacterium]
MKYLLLLTLLTSCGVTERLNKNCGADIKMGCNLIFGSRDDDQDTALWQVSDNQVTLQQTIGTRILGMSAVNSTQIKYLQSQITV